MITYYVANSRCKIIKVIVAGKILREMERYIYDDEIVSRFFLRTCELCNTVNLPAIHALLFCTTPVQAVLPGRQQDSESQDISSVTGSVAEFYIDPMFPCIGDIDIMYYRCSQLAIPAGHLTPTQLPAEFERRVEVVEINDSEYPGYVYLMKSYLLAECEDSGKYYAMQFEPQYVKHDDVYLNPATDDIMHQYIHGPALACHFPWLENMHNKMPSMPKPFYSLDRVSSRRCLWWPSHATDWPTRNRKYGWPDSATVDRVVTGGCDVVPVAHHLCRQDEWMSKHQWRLSFSRAEVVLPKQQIVFHMLRFYVKTERLPETGDNGGSTLSNYRIKTLMLWACELRPRSWWTDDNNLVEICAELLHILSVWLTDIRCKHYFISNCNLFDGTDNPRSIQLTGNHLRSLTSQSLAKWYINNYIRRCADGIRYLGAEVSRLFDDISTSAKIQRAVSAVVDWRHVYKTVSPLFEESPFCTNAHHARCVS